MGLSFSKVASFITAMFCLHLLLHSAVPVIACENIRFSSLFVDGDVSRAAKSEEKRMFSQAIPISEIHIFVVVNFLSQVIFVFLLFLRYGNVY